MLNTGDKVAYVGKGDTNPRRFKATTNPRKGTVSVVMETVEHNGERGVIVKDWPSGFAAGRNAWHENSWKKIQPCDPKFIELLNRIKPKVDA